MLERRRDANTQKLGWLLASRLLLAFFSIAVIAISAGEHLKESSFYPAYFLLVIVCFVDLIYLIVYRLRGGSTPFITLQIGLDVIFVTLLILLSGASRSSFSVLYYAVVLGGLFY